VDRRKELDLALFPGYVFVRMALASRLRVLQLPGVVRLVSFHGQLAAFPAEEIAALQDRLSRGLKIEPHPYLRAGRRVQVRSGPMPCAPKTLPGGALDRPDPAFQ